MEVCFQHASNNSHFIIKRIINKCPATFVLRLGKNIFFKEPKTL